MSPLAPTLQVFFTERLIKQRQASPRTIASYRDTCGLLLRFVQNRTGKAPSRAGLGRPRCRDDLGVPGAPGDRAAQQRAQPQHAAGRDPLTVPLRRAAPP